MLFLIGLGLSDEKDITIKGLEAIKSCDYLYLEGYTSILSGIGTDKLETFYGKSIKVLDREHVEGKESMHDILMQANQGNVAILVVGDPFGATTHTDLYLRAHELNINVQVIHNASIMTAIGSCGLQLYKFGPSVSIPLFTDNWKPISFYEKIKFNMQSGLHTLCLLDIKVKEMNEEDLFKGKKNYSYAPPRFMTVKQALEQLIYAEHEKQEHLIDDNVLVVAMMRIGSHNQKIITDTIGNMLNHKEDVFGPPLHSLIIPSMEGLHELENKMLDIFRI
jgi:diphthine methyl ester synthase